jgi:hypothetical protein
MNDLYIVHFASRNAIIDLEQIFAKPTVQFTWWGWSVTTWKVPPWVDTMLAFAFTDEELQQLRHRFTSRG